MAIANTDGHRPIFRRPDRIKKLRKGEFVLSLNWDTHLLLTLDVHAPDSWTFRLGLGRMPTLRL